MPPTPIPVAIVTFLQWNFPFPLRAFGFTKDDTLFTIIVEQGELEITTLDKQTNQVIDVLSAEYTLPITPDNLKNATSRIFDWSTATERVSASTEVKLNLL